MMSPFTNIYLYIFLLKDFGLGKYYEVLDRIGELDANN